jgi:glycosyltransferase involved in cell wall biosynthesis
VIRLGLSGCEPHPWPSVERTRDFYLRALGELALEQPGEACGWFDPLPDAVLNFSASGGWERLSPHPPCPLLFALHGGPVLDHEFLRAQAGRLEATDVLIVNCSSDLPLLRRMFAGPAPRLCHLPLPVDSAVFRPRARSECREELPLERTDFVVGFVARLLPQKNLHQFLRLVAELKRRLRPRTVSALVIGRYWLDYPVLPYVTGGYPQRIGALIAELGLEGDVAYFTAGLDDDQLALCYGAMDLLIHPTNSLDENFGYSPLEAMACGTPVLGAAYGGLKDTVISGGTGFLMSTWTSDGGIRMDLLRGTDEAVRLLLDGELRERMGEAGVRRALEAYSFAACAAILRGAVEEAVAAHRAGGARPLAPVPAVPDPPEAGVLPAVHPPWEHYRGSAEAYVSGPPPSPGPGRRFRVAAPLLAEDGGFRLDDPAWPALFRLAGPDLAIVRLCREEVSWECLDAAGLAEEDRLRRLIASGLLLATGDEP